MELAFPNFVIVKISKIGNEKDAALLEKNRQNIELFPPQKTELFVNNRTKVLFNSNTGFFTFNVNAF